MSIEIFGIYEKTLFRDERTAATYFSMKVPESVKERNRYGCVIVSANIPEYQKGIPLYAEGEWQKAEKGLLFKASLIREEAWHQAFTAAYLSLSCKGISYRMGEKLIAKYGRNVFEEIRETAAKDIASGVLGLTERKAQKLKETITETVAQRELFDFILHYGGFYTTAVKLCKEYGAAAKKILCEHPFDVGMRFGLSFEQCDAIARDMGGHAASQKRIEAAANTVMNRSTTSGNTFMYQNNLLYQMEKLLEKSVYPETIPYSVIVGGIEKNERLFTETDSLNRVFIKSMRFAEINTTLQIKRLMESAETLNFNDILIDKVEKACHITYAPQQREAFSCLKQTGISVITGGPGTGKTTTINGIISAYEEMYPEKTVRLCAPTGRAAQRMMESTGKEAVTLHRLLEYRPFGNNGEITHKTADDPIDADFIVVDETSMLDIDLANIFLSAVRSGTLVLLVGDINQLPSVGAGDVLHDLIASERIPVYQLTTVYRQAKESPIVANAIAINEGIDELAEADDFRIVFRDLPLEIKEAVICLIEKLYDSRDPFATQVLVPTHKGDAGVTALNNALQELLNPKSSEKKEMKYGSKTFRTGDKILMLNNNYAKGYYNGDLGIIERITDEGLYLRLLDKSILLTRDLMDDINLAYAMSIHKSQGSEFKNVIVALSYQPVSMLKRNLLYTAITRAKEKVVIVSENGAVAKAIMTCETGKRKTRLTERLKETIEERRLGTSNSEGPAA